MLWFNEKIRVSHSRFNVTTLDQSQSGKIGITGGALVV